jgi:hypothetical protein
MSSSAANLAEKLETLSPQQIATVEDFVEFLLTRGQWNTAAAVSTPLSASLATAPVEEEDLTQETAAALDRARASLALGKSVPHEEVLREFGS